jgi:NAD(P)-dependent dehydrogenase (short-subunit alcohol dehydrogenase family)
MDLGLKDKVAIVTGAGSQTGFGKSIAMTLAKEGCDIVAADINMEGAKKTAADVEALDRKAMAVKVDVTKKADIDAMVKQTLDKFSKIDILVNNAGAMLSVGGEPFLQQNEERWDREIALNLKGCMLCSQAVIPSMIDRKYGKIVNITSESAKMVWPMVAMYNIAKAGANRFTRELAMTVIGYGIYVNCVSPGWSLDTDFVKEDKDTKDALKPSFLADTPIRRGTTPQDVANAVAFFVSDISSDITGQILSVSGGSTMQ